MYVKCKDIVSINPNFFWKDNYENNNTHKTVQSLAWNKICRPKCKCGLGIIKKLKMLMLPF